MSRSRDVRTRLAADLVRRLARRRADRFADADPLALGVAPAAGHEEHGLPAYVPRDCEPALERAVEAGGLVVVHGRVAAGTSRTAFEVVRRVRGDWDVVAPADAAALRRLADDGFDTGHCVVWLDGLDRFLLPGGLADMPLPPLVVATVRDAALRRLDAAPADGTPGAATRLVRRAHRVAVADRLSDAELRRAEASDDPRIVAAARLAAGTSLGAYLTGAAGLMALWSEGSGTLHDVGQAFVAAAVDCRRTGYDRPVPAAVLDALHRAYLSPARRGRTDLPPAADGLEWGTSSGCLTAHPGDTYRAADLLVDRTESGEGPQGLSTPPVAVRQAMLALATGDELLAVGVRAFADRDAGAADAAFARAVAAGDDRALGHLAAVRLVQDRPADAEQLLLRALERDPGNPAHRAFLGTVLAEQGRDDEAAGHLRAAAEAGDDAAAGTLGLLLAGGDDAAAEPLLRRALAIDPRGYGLELGRLLLRRGDYPAAERVVRPLAERGDGEQGADAEAGELLGTILAGEGRYAEAITHLRRAADSGAPGAAFSLGLTLELDGDAAAAGPYLRRAAEAGDPDALTHYVDHLLAHGGPGPAEQFLRGMVAAGDDVAAGHLGMLLFQDAVQDTGGIPRRREPEILGLLMRGARAGLTRAAGAAGFLLFEAGRYPEAERALRAAAPEDDNVAGYLGMCILRLHTDPASLREAAELLRRGAAHGNALAAQTLEYLEDMYGED
ncbi:tetratricopeptide repeat protein [Spirilliplanes yamanashiensis]|uniref:tetratricopeptide repeat protein n=1 Tax=Spirilliplanes yamanashiensis TaxID=42233 RepID=UPI00194DB22B|nr:tetratricopeptide repeat protein [Spirilliplanes yamanashiensis]